MGKKFRKSNVIENKDKLRLSVHRSLKNISVQIIDDNKGITVTSTSSLTLKVPGHNIEGAKKVGTSIAELAKKSKVNEVWFDRGRFQYKGRIKALAEAAREAGLVF